MHSLGSSRPILYGRIGMREEEVGARGKRLQPRPAHVPVTLQLHVLEIERLVAQRRGRPGVGGRRERPRLERARRPAGNRAADRPPAA